MYMYTNLIVSIGEDIDELCDGPGVAQLAQAVRHLMLEQGGLVTEASLHLSRTIVIQFSNQVHTTCTASINPVQMYREVHSTTVYIQLQM